MTWGLHPRNQFLWGHWTEDSFCLMDDICLLNSESQLPLLSSPAGSLNHGSHTCLQKLLLSTYALFPINPAPLTLLFLVTARASFYTSLLSAESLINWVINPVTVSLCLCGFISHTQCLCRILGASHPQQRWINIVECGRNWKIE